MLQPGAGELKSMRDWVRWGASRLNEAGVFFGHGTDNALDEALALILHAVHLNHDLPVEYLDARVTAAEAEAIHALLRERVERRVPAAYLIGEARFAGLDFYVDENVLIPRSPIAELIAEGFAPWLDADHVGSVLDLCCGSGCNPCTENLVMAAVAAKRMLTEVAESEQTAAESVPAKVATVG